MVAYAPYWFKPCWAKDSGRLLYYVVYDGDTVKRGIIAMEAKSLIPQNHKSDFKIWPIGSYPYITNLNGKEIPCGSIVLIDRTEGLMLASEKHFKIFYTTQGENNGEMETETA